MKKIIALALALLLLCACVTGCGKTEENPSANNSSNANGETAEPVEIVMWHTLTDHHQEALNKIVDAFNASQNDYVVVAEQQPYSEYNAKLLQAVSTGSGPDFVSMYPSDAINYINEGYLYDMTDLISDPETGIADFKEQLVEGTYAEVTQWDNGKIYMMPVTACSEVLFYNKTMFDALNLSEPTTWEELENCAKAIYEAYGIAGFGTDSVTDTFQGWMVQKGSDYIDVDAKEIAIDREIAIETLEWFANAIEAGHFRLVGEDYFFSNPFGSQAVGMYIGSAAGIDYVYAAIPEGEGSFELGCCPIPQAGVKDYIASWGDTYVCLSNDESHARGVLEFYKFMSQKDTLIDWAIACGTMPARKEAVEDARIQAYAETNIAAKALVEEYERIGYLPSVVGAATVRTEIDKMVQTVALGTVDAETAFDSFTAACNAALQEG